MVRYGYLKMKLNMPRVPKAEIWNRGYVSNLQPMVRYGYLKMKLNMPRVPKAEI